MKAFCLLLLQPARPEGPPGLRASNVEEGETFPPPTDAGERMAIPVGWHRGLLCSFPAPLEMLVVPWGKGTIEDCGFAAPSSFMPPPLFGA